VSPFGVDYSAAASVTTAGIANNRLGGVVLARFRAMMRALAQATGMCRGIRSGQRQRGKISRERNEQQ